MCRVLKATQKQPKSNVKAMMAETEDNWSVDIG